MDAQLHEFLTSALDGSGELHAPAALPSAKEPPYPSDRSGPQSQSERGDEEKNSLDGFRRKMIYGSILI
jgi:hypothetical protein